MNDSNYTNINSRIFSNEYDIRNKSIFFIPRETDAKGNIVYLQSIHSFSKILKRNGFECVYEKGENVSYLEQHSIDVFLPTIAILLDFYLENNDVINLIIESVKTYISSVSFPKDEKVNVRFGIEIVDKKNNTATKINYDGPKEGIDEVRKCIKELKK